MRMPATPERRWFQFRLRTLLIAVALLAFPCWLVGEGLWTMHTRHEMLKARDEARERELKAGRPDPWDTGP
jgi:hypothetical protein